MTGSTNWIWKQMCIVSQTSIDKSHHANFEFVPLFRLCAFIIEIKIVPSETTKCIQYQQMNEKCEAYAVYCRITIQLNTPKQIITTCFLLWIWIIYLQNLWLILTEMQQTITDYLIEVDCLNQSECNKIPSIEFLRFYDIYIKVCLKRNKTYRCTMWINYSKW